MKNQPAQASDDARGSRPAVLLTEDDEAIRRMLEIILAQHKYEVYTARNCSEAIGYIEERDFDLLLLDKNLPDGDCFDIVERAKELGRQCAMIIITAYYDTESAIRSVALGVFRYVCKPFDTKALMLDVEKSIEDARLRRDLVARTLDVEQKSEELVESEQRYRMLFDAGYDAVFVYPFAEDDRLHRFVEVNEMACAWLGYTRDELLEMTMADLGHPDFSLEISSSAEHLDEKRHVLFESNLTSRDGRLIPVEFSRRLFSFRGREMVLDVARDITERRRAEEERLQLEAQFREAQKMDAIGRLAGGVAHDMNNVLGVILGFASALKTDIAEDTQQRVDVEEILTACLKGRDLVRDLLGFARRGKYTREKVELNDLIVHIRHILTRTIPKSVAVDVDLTEDLPFVEGDTGQLHHAVMNVCLNGVDAMGGDGRLKIATRVREVDEKQAAQHAKRSPGRYVEVSVTDDGAGMSEETRSRIFEPFYTTKPPGKGTGLGLAMVYGAVDSHLGIVDIETEPGAGTCFRVLLPAMPDETAENWPAEQQTSLPPSSSPADPARPSQSEYVAEHPLILLVDDEPAARRVGVRLLEQLGYRVIEAGNGLEAVHVYTDKGKEIAAVLLDMIMPVMDGAETVSRLMEMDPGVKILLASGYAQEDKIDKMLERGARGLVQKPFDGETLRVELDALLAD